MSNTRLPSMSIFLRKVVQYSATLSMTANDDLDFLALPPLRMGCGPESSSSVKRKKESRKTTDSLSVRSIMKKRSQPRHQIRSRRGSRIRYHKMAGNKLVDLLDNLRISTEPRPRELVHVGVELDLAFHFSKIRLGCALAMGPVHR